MYVIQLCKWQQYKLFGQNMDKLKLRLGQSAAIAVTWYIMNEMEANASIPQGMIIPHGSAPLPTTFRVSNNQIPIETNVKVLGIFIDIDLNFSRYMH